MVEASMQVKCRWILFGLLIGGLFSVAEAVCPVCFVAAGAGVGLSQYLQIDDLITGLWLGAMLYALMRITTNITHIRFGWSWVVSWLLFGIAYYLGTMLVLDRYGMLGHELNVIYGIDRLVLGVGLGTLLSLVGDVGYWFVKRNHNHRAWFPFQKVVMVMVPLLAVNWMIWYWGW